MRVIKLRTRTVRNWFSHRVLARAAVVLCLVSTCAAQTAAAPQDPFSQELNKYPGLLPELGKLIDRLKNEVQFPPDRTQSTLLTQLPASTQYYAAFPNYGDAVHQAMAIFQQELNASSALRDWSQHGMSAVNALTLEKNVESFYQLSQYLGNEVVLSGGTAAGKTQLIVLAEIRKPGLKMFLQQALQQWPVPSAPAVHVIDEQELAHLDSRADTRPIILVRQDVVVAGPNIAEMRILNSFLNEKSNGFGATPFGQRLARSYQGGASVVAGANVAEIIHQVPGQPAQLQQTYDRLGFDNVKFAIWTRKTVAGQPISQMDLNFDGPRHGVAAWLAAPAALNSLDYVSPKAAMVATINLKNLADIFDGARELGTLMNPSAFASVDQMQQMMNINLRNDLLRHLEGEVTLEFDGLVERQPVWKVILRVNDVDSLQQTLTKLLATTGQTPTPAAGEDGVKYYSFVVPSPEKPISITYAFSDGYMIVASSNQGAKEAIQLHRRGESLAKSDKFLSSAATGRSVEASGFFYYDPILTSAMRMQTVSPELAQLYSRVQSKAIYVRSYGEADAIRVTSSGGGADAGLFLVMGAIAVPNILRAKTSANESSAVSTMRNIVTAQVAYSATYPQKGYARDLAALGLDPRRTGEVSAEHAGFIDWTAGGAACLPNAVCSKSGYRFSMVSRCQQSKCSEYTAFATPVTNNTGTRSFCSTSDGVLRFSLITPATPTVTSTECRSWTRLDSAGQLPARSSQKH